MTASSRAQILDHGVLLTRRSVKLLALWMQRDRKRPIDQASARSAAFDACARQVESFKWHECGGRAVRGARRWCALQIGCGRQQDRQLPLRTVLQDIPGPVFREPAGADLSDHWHQSEDSPIVIDSQNAKWREPEPDGAVRKRGVVDHQPARRRVELGQTAPGKLLTVSREGLLPGQNVAVVWTRLLGRGDGRELADVGSQAFRHESRETGSVCENPLVPVRAKTVEQRAYRHSRVVEPHADW